MNTRMDATFTDDMRHLLETCRLGSLATTGAHGPESSMAPFALHDGKLLLHLSALAGHTSNLSNNPAAGFMICTPETESGSPLALPRLSLQGKISPVTDHRLDAARATYLTRIPEAEPLFAFADFRLFELTPTHIRWVGGFGSARDISLGTWQNIVAK